MQWCPLYRPMLADVEGAAGVSVCPGCRGAWARDGATADQAAAALAAVGPENTSDPNAASYEGLAQPCPRCLSTWLVAAPGEAPHCDRCGGVWLTRDRLRAVGATAPARQGTPAAAQDGPPTRGDVPERAAEAAPLAAPPLESSGAQSEYRPALEAADQPVAAEAVTPAPIAAPDRVGPPPVAAPPAVVPPRASIEPPFDYSVYSDPRRALAWLGEGNSRYAAGRALAPHQTAARRNEIVEQQRPVAAVLGCSDSRVPPELLFDAGLGDLFVVRSAGHVLDQVGLQSLRYAVEHLGVRLILVLGHSSCGAVRAAMAPGEPPATLSHLLKGIRRAIEWSASAGDPSEQRTIRYHSLLTAAAIRRNLPEFAAAEARGEALLAPAYYDLSTGVVELVPSEEPPSPPAAPPPEKTETLEPLDRRSRLNKALGRTDTGRRPAAQAAEPPSVTAPASDAAAKAERWCPHCMTGFPGSLQFCTGCGRALVEPWFRIICPKCRKENLIGTPRCWQCGAELHASPARPAPPQVRLGGAGKPGEVSCGSIVAGGVALAVVCRLLWGA